MSTAESSRSSDQTFGEFRYSQKELLSLRDQLPVIICNVKKMSNNTGGKNLHSLLPRKLLILFSDLLRLPAKIMSDPNVKSCHTRSLRRVPNFKLRDEASSSEDNRLNRRKTTDDSDEEEIVYRGHPIRHSLKETQWQFKRRDDSNRSSQPLSAPSGYQAQKAENFQKFYRAVVSPTHVRVTAGGRIVPNIRAPPQPVFVWNRDKFFFESKQDKKGSGFAESTWPEGAALRPSDPNQLPVNAPHASANSARSLNPQSLDKFLNSGNTQPSAASEQRAPASMFSGTVDQANSTGPHPVQLSPPSQFDMTKPFMINGQMIYPLPPNFQVPQGVPVLPFSMIGNTPPQQHLQQYPHASSHSQSTFQTSEVSSGQTQATSYNSQLSNAPTVQMLPRNIFGPIPPSVLTTKNIERNNGMSAMPPLPGLAHQPLYGQPRYVRQKIQSLQDEIKKFDHQLEHNRHQIDEVHVKKQRFYVQSQIQTLEASLALLPFEEPSFSQSFPGAPSRHSVVASGPPSPLPSWPKSPAYNSKSFDGAYEQAFLNYASSSRGNHSEPLPNTTPNNPDPVPHTKVSVAKSEQPTGTRLTLSAAKAPPFKPRSQQPLQQPMAPTSATVNDEGAYNDAAFDAAELSNPTETLEEIEARLTNNGNRWFALKDEGIRPASNSCSPERARPIRTLENYSYENGLLTSVSQFPGTGPFQTPPDFSRIPPIPLHTSGVPYLMGFPPPGIPWKEAKSQELLYTRPLNSEEVRARHLYWGNASKESRKGLPKFDGQDFYPASPKKTSSVPVSQGRSSEASTVVRKSKNSSTTSKELGSSEESRALGRTGSIGDGISPGKPVNQRDEQIHENDDKVSVDSWGASKSVSTPPKATLTLAPKASRLYSQNSSSFLLGMLKNSPTVSSPLSGLSSTHAVGCLPNYGGTAVPSLAPGSRPRSSVTFDSSAMKLGRSASNLSIRHENRPPSQAGSVFSNVYTASELLSKVTRQDGERQLNTEPEWKSGTDGVGPVAGSNW